MAGFTLSNPGALIVAALNAVSGGALPTYAVQTGAPVSCLRATTCASFRPEKTSPSPTATPPRAGVEL